MDIKLDLIKKEIIKNGDKIFKWFVETDDGFDGTADGYGYNSPQKLYNAYWYFKNKSKSTSLRREVYNFLKENPDIKQIIDDYMDLDWQLDRLKDNEPTSIPDLIELIEDDNDIIDKNNIIKRLNNVNYLWEFIMIYYDNYIPEGH
jgi:hypothetical protein